MRILECETKIVYEKRVRRRPVIQFGSPSHGHSIVESYQWTLRRQAEGNYRFT